MQDYTDFYNTLETHNLPLKDLLQDESLFTSVPKNWHIVVTDVKDSSQAVAQGNHNDINLTATGSIIAVLNEVKKIDSNLAIPYFFGGDGATFIIPPNLKEQIMLILNDYALHIAKVLRIDLRVGFLKVEEAYNRNYTLRISKLKLNNYLTTPVIVGNGLKYAEAKIKSNFKKSLPSDTHKLQIDLEGMECRWDEIFPSQKSQNIACLLISAMSESKQSEIFNEIMNELDYIFGDLNNRHPITVNKLKLKPTLAKIRTEMHARIGKFDRAYLVKNWLITLFGKYYFKFFKTGQLYLYKVTQLSDTIMIDGSINTIISGNERQLRKLKTFLDSLESQNKIIYGLHITYASVMSCYVEDRDEKHIHFVDGTEGGYTTASIAYKEKLKRHYAT